VPANVKLQMMECLRVAARRFKAPNPTWLQVAFYLPKWNEMRMGPEQLPGEPPVESVPVMKMVKDKDVDVQSDGSSSSGSALEWSSSASVASAYSNLDGRFVEWVATKGIHGRPHFLVDDAADGENITACRRHLQDATSGVGLSSALDLAKCWSPGCFRNMPRNLQKEWLQEGAK